MYNNHLLFLLYLSLTLHTMVRKYESRYLKDTFNSTSQIRAKTDNHNDIILIGNIINDFPFLFLQHTFSPTPEYDMKKQ